MFIAKGVNLLMRSRLKLIEDNSLSNSHPVSCRKKHCIVIIPSNDHHSFSVMKN